MSYETATSTILLASSCLCCGRPLRDAVSVETGVGPVCREKFGYYAEATDEARTIANGLIHEAAVSATTNDRRLEIATTLDELGFAVIAKTIRKRFLKAAVTIETIPVVFGSGQYAKTVDAFVVNSRYSPEFVESLKAAIDWKQRTIVKDEKGKFAGWAVLPSAKAKLWELVQTHFKGETGFGPRGAFAI